MPTTGRELVERIERGLTCPSCGYSLQGHAGRDVRCPECGADVDIDAMYRSQWTGPWYRAPGFTEVCVPLVVAFIGALVALMLAVLAPPEAFLVTLLLVGLGWGWAIVRAVQVVGSQRAILLALLTHVVMGAYVGGLFGMFWGTASAFGRVPARGIVVAAIGIAIVIGARYGERGIALACIKLYRAKMARGAVGSDAESL